MPKRKDWRTYFTPLQWPARAAVLLLGHVALAGLIYASIWALQYLAHVLYGENLPLIYGRFPLEWLFQTMDVSVIVVFVVRGIIAADRELRKK